ncbi:MAG TPA: DPP IV N-terminal domain-containing protein [Gemmatimonadales bacterium]|nr:DPP IV N-terminal domain-containing protein [Gemmatimonadales bacterium]
MTRLLLSLALLCPALPLPAQQADSLLSVQRIYGTSEFRGQTFGPVRWLADGSAYTVLEDADNTGGQNLVRYDTEHGGRQVLLVARQFIPPEDSVPLRVEDYAWSADRQMLLLFTHSQPVWRLNTRGDYWVLELATGRLRKLGGPEARPSTLMFAKFSPDSRQVGYVRENNLYVEDLVTGRITPLTTDGSRTLINGTFDWVYEEELMDYHADGWRWSPDGHKVAYWQLNADSVKNFDLIDNTDSLYSYVRPVQYPKAGKSNSAARIGVVNAAGGATQWLDLTGDPRDHYIPRMDWAGNSDEVVLQRLNRLQNTNDVLLGDARTGAVRTVLTEHDSAWVEVVNDLTWLDRNKSFLWVSERDGWRHAYTVSRDGKSTRLVTRGAYDISKIIGADEKNGWLYFVASPDQPSQQYLFRTRLNGAGPAERLTPEGQPGTHEYERSPNLRYALETFSSFGQPPVLRVVRLPGHETIRTLADNAALRRRLASLTKGKVEFFSLPAPDGARMPAYLMKPVGFDSTRRYPLLLHVYGGPGGTTVNDAWGGYYLWHLMLTQRGYLVASIDNRGTPAPLGRRWRKSIYGQLGVNETIDQANGVESLAQRPYVDRSRIGMWGWSYGGFMTLNSLFQHPELFRTGVAVSPVTHWALYDNVYTERFNGLPSTNRAGYDRGSPLSYVRGFRGNLLLIHGSGDDNVHYQNSEILINALVSLNKPFTLMEYPNRTHCLCQGRNTQLHLFELITRYLDQNLKDVAPTSTAADQAVVGAGAR